MKFRGPRFIKNLDVGIRLVEINRSPSNVPRIQTESNNNMYVSVGTGELVFLTARYRQLKSIGIPTIDTGD